MGKNVIIKVHLSSLQSILNNLENYLISRPDGCRQTKSAHPSVRPSLKWRCLYPRHLSAPPLFPPPPPFPQAHLFSPKMEQTLSSSFPPSLSTGAPRRESPFGLPFHPRSRHRRWRPTEEPRGRALLQEQSRREEGKEKKIF